MLRHASAEVGADVVAAVVAIAVSVADGGGGGSSGGHAVFVGADPFCGARPAKRNRSREVRLHFHVSLKVSQYINHFQWPHVNQGTSCT